MKHYIEIAKQYFEHMEGLHLYPPICSYRFMLWFLTLIIWLGTVVLFLVMQRRLPQGPMLCAVVASEVVWLVVAAWVGKWKTQQVIATTNQRFAVTFEDVSACRQHVLQELVARPPSEYLSAAKEIRDLVELRNKFRKRSDLDFSEVGRSIYDRDSKARLLTLLIALCSMVVALSVRSDATLKAIFDVYSNPGGQTFITFLVVLALAGFIMLIGLRVLMLSVLDWLALWGAKVEFLRHILFVDWVVGYLMRDLVAYHGVSKQTTLVASIGFETETRACSP